MLEHINENQIQPRCYIIWGIDKEFCVERPKTNPKIKKSYSYYIFILSSVFALKSKSGIKKKNKIFLKCSQPVYFSPRLALILQAICKQIFSLVLKLMSTHLSIVPVLSRIKNEKVEKNPILPPTCCEVFTDNSNAIKIIIGNRHRNNKRSLFGKFCQGYVPTEIEPSPFTVPSHFQNILVMLLSTKPVVLHSCSQDSLFCIKWRGFFSL